MPLMYRRPDAQDHHDPPVALARRDPGGLPLSRTRVLPRDEARSRALMGRWRKSGPPSRRWRPRRRHWRGADPRAVVRSAVGGLQGRLLVGARRLQVRDPGIQALDAVENRRDRWLSCGLPLASLRRALRGDGDGWRSSGARGVGQRPQGSPGRVPSTWLGRRDSEARLSSAPLIQNLHGGPSVHPGEALAEGPGRLQRGYPLRYFPVQRRSTWGRCACQRRPARCGRRNELDVGPVQTPMDAIDLPRPLFDGGLPVPGEFPQLARGPVRSETGLQEPRLEQIGDPCDIQDIGLAARAVLRRWGSPSCCSWSGVRQGPMGN